MTIEELSAEITRQKTTVLVVGYLGRKAIMPTCNEVRFINPCHEFPPGTYFIQLLEPHNHETGNLYVPLTDLTLWADWRPQ